MCWTPAHTRQKRKTNKTKNTTQYVLDTTTHKTKDEDKQNKNTTQYVLDITTHKRKDKDKQNKKS
jgi:DNA-binding protein